MFKEFLFENLFKSSTGDVDLQQKDVNGKGCFLINSGVENRGIKGKTDRKARIFPANTITVDFWGNAYYRDFEYKMATHNHVFSLTGAVIKNRLVGLYLESVLSKLPMMFSYNNMLTWNKLKLLSIKLPVIESLEPNHEYTVDDIDFIFMQDRIAKLMQERIVELTTYFVASGFEEYVISDEEKQQLSINLQNKHLSKIALLNLVMKMGR